MGHIVINGLSLRPGGGLQVMTAILAGLISKDRGHHYTVLWSDLNTGKFLKNRFGKETNITFLDPVGTSNNMKLFLWQMSRLKGCLVKLNADIMIGLNHHFPSGVIPQIIYHVNVLRFDRPQKAIFSGGELADRLRDWRARKALKSAQANVFESSYLQELASACVKNIVNPSLIYIGLENPADIIPTAFIKTNNPTILSLTSPQLHKDNPTLIKTLAVLKTRRPEVNWTLKIAGGTNPDAFSDLHELAGELGVADYIDWLGFQNHEALAQIGSKALCLVSTSQVESFCMVAVEAMSWSCPAIVANATSMPESIGDAGRLANVGDADDFADKIIEIYDDINLRQALVNKGHAHIKALTWESAADSFENIVSALKPARKVM